MDNYLIAHLNRMLIVLNIYLFVYLMKEGLNWLNFVYRNIVQNHGHRSKFKSRHFFFYQYQSIDRYLFRGIFHLF